MTDYKWTNTSTRVDISLPQCNVYTSLFCSDLQPDGDPTKHVAELILYKAVICFLLGNSPASEFYMPTFRNTLSVPSS